ncbi:ATP-dependent helicase HrpB [Lutimaribacter saemankumensis]|uniref:ATP-dependent helicase HrpB n=1 Tax=Lutimaribacter saemankumensis TaxID=490829 RepID=A0A1G8MAF9_9RHOB|nr:ATP-dependent helicase HrpB [Lutimaribacter saemankumensis]SDI64350.1 ATP-dependent helicase HrpB [Lutimaribacter saemankumensis]
MTTLPIHDAIPDLLAALQGAGRAVLQAPPGAGKTTVVPLEILRAGLTTGRIVMLEPRRLAARAAAERMAETLGEQVGQTVGYRIRGETRRGRDTRIEVVTEGILTRMLQSDPGLAGVGAVIFDEFHERSLNADLGLALCLEVAGALRDDLILLAMSATLDAQPVADLMEAPIVTSQGRSFPVDIRWRDTPVPKTARLEQATADLVAQAVSETTGGVLVFLPGEGEIRRTEALLKDRLPSDCALCPLYGAMPFAAQRAAIAPMAVGRKIVLATAIAETSLTIEDIRIVVDAGRARRARFDPGSGMARLVTERVTRAEATQRAGRAGRVAEGTCYRLWTKGEEGALAPFPPAEIEAADLSGLALELALWGAAPDDLPFLTQPNPGAYAEAQALLRMLGALDAGDRITDHGRALAALPLHPRLAHMLAVAGPRAAPMAALLAERDPLPRGAPVDLSLRLEAVTHPRRYAERHPHPANRAVVDRIRAESKRLEQAVPRAHADPHSAAEMAALAYPDRIGQRRSGDAPRFVLSGGKGAVLDDGDPLGQARLIVVTDTDGNPREARIRQAIAITESELRGLFTDRIGWVDTCAWSRRDRRVVARRQERLGAIVLDDRIWKDAPNDAIARAMLDGVRDLGLGLTDAARRFTARVQLARDGGLDLPDMGETALMDSLEDWLLPHLHGIRSAEDWKRFDPLEALRARLSWDRMQALDRAAPAHFTTPLGRRIAIDYSGEAPEIQLRLQEMFGQTTHPTVAGQPLRVTLLSPAGRPVQTTMDLPGFWAGSYADVRKDMRARYPKHPWPEDPAQADPTLRAKPRG